MAPKSPPKSPAQAGSGEDGGSPTANFERMSAKQLTAALEDREERFVEATKSIRKLEAETVQAESKAFKSEEEHDAALMEVDRQASHESTLASEAQQLAKELQELSTHREEIEARNSYGAYWRWRQRLQKHLGCSQEDADKGLEWLLPRGAGSMPSSQAAKTIDEARQWKQKVETMKTALASSEQKAFDLRRENEKAELQWMRLGVDLEEQKRWASDWWQYHLSQMPEYHQQHQRIQGLEARGSELAEELREARMQLDELQAHEDAIRQSAVAAQSELSEGEDREMQISQEVLMVSEECTALRLKVVPGGIPGDEDGIPLVRTWKQRLVKAAQDAERLDRETREAKEEERLLLSSAAKKETEIDQLEQRIKRVENNADLLSLRYKEQQRRLAERDREKERLVRASRDMAVDMERNRSILSSWGALRERRISTSERRGSAEAANLDIVDVRPAGRSRTPSPRPSDSASQQHQTREATSPVVESSGHRSSSLRRSSSEQVPALGGGADEARARDRRPTATFGHRSSLEQTPALGGVADEARAREAESSGSHEPGKEASKPGSRVSHKPDSEVHNIWNGTARSFNPDRWVPAGPNAQTARSQSASRSHGSQSHDMNNSSGKTKSHEAGKDVQNYSRRPSRSASPRPSLKDSGSPVLSGYGGEVVTSAPKPVRLQKRPL